MDIEGWFSNTTIHLEITLPLMLGLWKLFINTHTPLLFPYQLWNKHERVIPRTLDLLRHPTELATYLGR